MSRESGRTWQPHFEGADRFHVGRYRDANRREVDLIVAIFSRQEEGREIVGYGQGAIGPDSSWAWTAEAAPPPSGRADRIASHGTVREVASFYRIGGILTGSERRVKLEAVDRKGGGLGKGVSGRVRLGGR